VPPAGAFDRTSASLANALLGNDPTCAVIEFTLRGGVYEADGPTALALAGAPLEARICSRDGSERTLDPPVSFTLELGDRLVLGRALAGARGYLAVKGGWQTHTVLGSRSREERLRAGDILPAEFAILATDGHAHAELRGDRFWASRAFQVGSNSDRMGLRLLGEPLAISSDPDRLSTPVTTGAIQAAGGQLIVLGVAAGTMGGYPCVACVISADLDRLGQLRPGDTVSFRLVSLEEARATYMDELRARHARLLRVATLTSEA
jgi:allophanate hydrolase subunit 2